MGPADAVKIARAILPSDREGFLVMHLDSRHHMRSVELVSVGSLNAAIVHPREVFKGAILANAYALIFAHNHPSGDPEPSAEDILLTKRLAKGGAILDIPVLDHVVVGSTAHVSFKERKLL